MAPPSFRSATARRAKASSPPPMAALPGRRPHSPRRAPPSTTVGSVNATESPQTEIEQESIETIAAAWLAAEQELAGGSGNPEHSEMKARDLSARYDEA